MDSCFTPKVNDPGLNMDLETDFSIQNINNEALSNKERINVTESANKLIEPETLDNKPTQPSTSSLSIVNTIESSPQKAVGERQSHLVTTKPYQKNKQQKKRNYSLHPTLIHFDSLFGINNWSRFLVLKTDSKLTYQKLENFLLSRYSTEDMSIRQLKNNEWLIETPLSFNQKIIFKSPKLTILM